MPPNYRQHEAQPLARSERRGALVVAAAILLIGAGLGVWEVTGSGGAGRPKGPCVSIGVASSTGGAIITHCGAQARAWCAAEAQQVGEIAAQARSVCRREHL